MNFDFNVKNDQSFKEADRKKGGRPTIEDDQKAKYKIVLYFNQEEIDLIETLSRIHKQKRGKFAKEAVLKACRKELLF